MWKTFRKKLLKEERDNNDEHDDYLGFDELPDEVLIKIFGYLDPEELCRMSSVSRRFNEISSDDAIWQVLFARNLQWSPFRIQSLRDSIESGRHAKQSLKQVFICAFVETPQKEQSDRRRRLKWLREQQLGTANLKVSFLGSNQVGKSSVIIQATSDQFNTVYIHDESEVYYSLQMMVNGRMVFFHLCDTSGDLEELKHIRESCFQQVDAFVVCFSMVSPQSLDEALNHWIPMIRMTCAGAPIFLLGTMADLKEDFEDGIRGDPLIIDILDEQYISEKATAAGVKGFYTCSAFLGEGIIEAFQGVARYLLDSSKSIEEIDDQPQQLRKDHCILQ